MSVNTQSIPSMSELLSMVPESSYTKSAAFVDRRITQLQAVNNALLGESFVPGLEASFRVNPSQSCLLNLNECYFTINGELEVNYTIENDIGTTGAKSMAASIPILKPSALWILRAFSKINLSIGGTTLYNIAQPYNLSNFISMFYKDNRSIKNGEYVKDGFYPTQYSIENSKLMKKTSTSFDKYFLTAGAFLPIDDVFSLNITKSTLTKAGALFTANLVYEFTVNLQLKDMFPGLLNKKPLFGNSFVVSLNLDAEGYSGIKTAFATMAKIKKFNQFYLNVVSYGLNTEFAAKLNQIYSKPGLIEIVDDITYLQQGCVNLTNDTQLDIFMPLNLEWENQFVIINFPYMTSNNQGFRTTAKNIYGIYKNTDETYCHITPGASVDGTKVLPQVTDYLMKNPNDYDYLNIQRVEITADNQIIYTRSFNNSKKTPSPFGPNYQITFKAAALNDQGHTEAWDAATAVSYDDRYEYDYTELYQNYKDCRLYCGQYEEGALSYEDWLKYGFCICIPTHEFSKLTTPSSQLKISILFGPGVSANTPTGENITTFLNSYFDGQVVVQNKIQVIQKSSKGIVYNSFDNCAVKAISASFSQDIVVEDGSTEKIAQ